MEAPVPPEFSEICGSTKDLHGNGYLELNILANLHSILERHIQELAMDLFHGAMETCTGYLVELPY